MKFYDDFYIPQFKWQIIDCLSKRYPSDRGKFLRMKKKRLHRIYFEVRKTGRLAPVRNATGTRTADEIYANRL